jgi:hypothetical protein
MIYLAAVCHDIKSNTLEATWLEETMGADGKLTELKRSKCRNYSSEQKAEFDTDTGTTIYSALAGW